MLRNLQNSITGSFARKFAIMTILSQNLRKLSQWKSEKNINIKQRFDKCLVPSNVTQTADTFVDSDPLTRTAKLTKNLSQNSNLHKSYEKM